MAKYYLFLLIASIWCFTVLCVSSENVAAQGSNAAATDADPFNGNIETALQVFAEIDTTPNPLITLFRDSAKTFLDTFEKDKKVIQDAVTKGTVMEKKIQSISLTLKNSTVTLPAEFQSELEGIEKHAAAELKKLKEVEDVKDIDEMHKRHKEKYTEFIGKIKELSNFALAKFKKEEAAKKNQLNRKAVNINTVLAQAQTEEKSDAFHEEVKTKLIELLKTTLPVLFTIKKNAEAISKKKDVVSSALSNICNDLIKVEQMEYHLLGAHKDLFKKDFAFLTRSSMAQFAFAIMFGILF